MQPRPPGFTAPEPVANSIKNRCRYVSSRNVFFHNDNGNIKRLGQGFKPRPARGYYLTGFRKKLSRRQFLINSKRLGNETCSCSPIFVSTTLNPSYSNILHHSLCVLNRTPTPNVFALSEGLNLATNRYRGRSCTCTQGNRKGLPLQSLASMLIYDHAD